MFENVKEIILKVTRDCNLRCEYCYIRDKDKYRGERMSFETFQKLIQRIISDKKKNTRDFSPANLSIVFHGGEPTLLGITELTRFINYAREEIPSVSFSIQTNLTNITPEWIQFFIKNKIIIGTSIDGIHWQDSILRSNTSVIKKLQLLRKAKVDYGVLMVVNKENVHRFMKNAQSLLRHSPQQKMVKANFVENIYSSAHNYPEVSLNELYKHVFIPTLKLFLKTNQIIEANIHSAIELLIQNLCFEQETFRALGCTSNCMAKFCGGGHTVIEVDPDGNVCFCGRWSDAIPINKLGNFTKPGDFFGLESHTKALKLQLDKIKDIRIKHCDTCFAADVCGYGCIAFSYEKYKGKIQIRGDLVCEYAKRTKRFMLLNLSQIIYAYVASKGWEIRKDNYYYYLNILPHGKSLTPRQMLGHNLTWHELEPGKVYLKIAKKAVHQKIKERA